MSKPKRSKTRRGPLSSEEKQKIEEMFRDISAPEIARLLGRNVMQVNEYIKKILLAAASEPDKPFIKKSLRDEIMTALHVHPSWASIQKQFSPEELIFFENAWLDYNQQFTECTPTEIKQIHQMITLDIFMHRHNVERIKNDEEIKRLEKALRAINDKDPTTLNQNDFNYRIHLEQTLTACRGSGVSRTKEYSELLQRHQSINKDMKGTREQRVKNVEDKGKFMNLLRMLENEESRNRMGHISGLYDLAIENEKARLSQQYKYNDGEIDQPLLTPETVFMYGNQNEEEEESE